MRERSARLVLALLVALGSLAGFVRDGARDFHWHVVLGEQTLREHGIVRVDRLSHTAAGRPSFVAAWLADVVLAVAHRAAGYAGSYVLHGLCIAATLVLLVSAARRRGADATVAGALAVLALAGALPRLYLRPEMFAFPLFALVLCLLAQHERSGRRGWAIAAVVTMVAWANLHGSVIVGLVAIGLYALERAIRMRRDRRAVAEALVLPLLAFAAACVNPEGVGLPLAVRIVSPAFSTYVTEWQPLSVAMLTAPVWTMGLAVVATSLAAGRRTTPSLLLLVLVLSALTVRYHRFLPFALFAAVPLVGSNLAGAVERWGRYARPIVAVACGVGVLVVAGGLVGKVGTGPQPGVYPEAACRFVRTLAPRGRMFNSYEHGDYLLFCLPEQPVFLDQRAWSAYPDELYDRYIHAAASPEALRALTDAFDVGWAFVGDDPLARLMAGDRTHWRLRYFDDVAHVYTRLDRPLGAPNDEGGFRFLDPYDLMPLVNLAPDDVPAAQRELAEQAARCASCASTQLVRAALAVGTHDDAELEDALRAIGDERYAPEKLFLSARSATHRGDHRTAASLYHALRVVGARPLGAALLEAEALAKAGDRAQASVVLDEAAALAGGAAAAAALRAELLGAR